MNNKKSNKTKNVGVVEKPQTNEEWVFIPLPKSLIIKQTDTYILFKLGENISSIVSAKFKRKKESDSHIYLSVPPSYNFGCKLTSYDAETKKYVKVCEQDLSGQEIKEYLDTYDEDEIPDNEWSDLVDGLPF